MPGQYWNDSTGSDVAHDLLDPLASLLRVLEKYPPDEPRSWLARLDRWLVQDTVKMHAEGDYWPKRGIETLREALGGAPQSPSRKTPLHFGLDENVLSSPARVASSSLAHIITPSELYTPQDTTSEESPAEYDTAPPPGERFAWSASMATGASKR